MSTAGRNTVSGRTYRRTRPRGFADWSPKPDTLALVDQVRAVLDEYRAHLPMTARQVFYRLVGAFQYPKEEKAYDRLQETLNRARRARLIPMDAIRDDRAASAGHSFGYNSPAEFWASVRASASYYSRPLDEGQPRAVEVWIEAQGMMPMIAEVTRQYGVVVYCSGGFESVCAKHDAAARIAYREVPTTVLSIGDYDPSGLSILDAAAEDVAAFVAELGGTPPTVKRLAVTEEQITRYALETAPQKATDRRGDLMFRTVQAEAISPTLLTDLVRAGVEEAVDLRALERVRARAERERQRVVAKAERLR
ncbi:hypothetical protein [Streptomyces sp. NBC_00847]|uniref:hypothetical protein n=1 Tax=Streptomyces sp. NBC_00847 TaxID=2975850 RepID=UPI00225DD4F5|nr:hypothetical protein [Streptomyces sp. NBC_00847]MCX4885964.1 hypothetical protein [Streptomyces sp. NBC_00847]